MTDEKTCETCSWYQRQNEVSGHCRHPRNAIVSSASSYNGASATILEPPYVRFHKVCDLHEVLAPSNIRDAFAVRPIGSDSDNPYLKAYWAREQ